MIEITISAKEEVVDAILDFINDNGLVALVVMK